MKETKIYIHNLLLRTIVGIKPDERVQKQDVVLNIEIVVDAEQAIEQDNIELALDYRSLTKEIIEFVESSHFYLLERLVHEVLQIILKKEQVLRCKVKVDKPHALRFAQSVAVEMEGWNKTEE
ncbi:MAG: FolB domain-containing protein [Planctomycetota bacterium]|nr:MAG: FolB domain-containing protein [Planctomycetota bacterium]